MASSMTKLRTLYIMKILLERSDEFHILSTEDINKILMEEYEMKPADRKTIYSEIDTMDEFGLDIVKVNGGVKPGYYIASREFELPELKLLVDAVQSSKFITAKKSATLIKKLERLTSQNNAKRLKRDVFIYNRPKTGNETIYYNVDEIHNALIDNKQIEFKYTAWNINKELVEKKDGEIYTVSPWSLTWDDENYYLIAYEETSNTIRHYRVDKMKSVTVIDEARLGKEAFQGFDLAAFAKKTFGMYGGRDEKVRLVCDEGLVGVILDRFGTDTILAPGPEGKFTISVLVSISPQFFGWVAGLGTGIYIDAPKNVQKEYVNYIDGIRKQY